MTYLGSRRYLRAASTFALAAALSASAHGSIRQWDYTPGMSGITALNNEGGTFHDLSSQYDSTTRTLTWSAEFSDRVTEGFTLVISNGQTPAGRRGQYAIIYFDASAIMHGLSSVPRLTAYAYNGRGSPDSWFDGDGNPLNNGATPDADCIKTLWDSDWINSSSAGNTVLAGGILGRTFSFSINATDLINHAPTYPSAPGNGWIGTGYGDQLGVWMFTAGVFDAEYSPDGRLASLGTELRGNILGGNLPTGGVPAPGAAALFLTGLIAFPRRRRDE